MTFLVETWQITVWKIAPIVAGAFVLGVILRGFRTASRNGRNVQAPNPAGGLTEFAHFPRLGAEAPDPRGFRIRLRVRASWLSRLVSLRHEAAAGQPEAAVYAGSEELVPSEAPLADCAELAAWHQPTPELRQAARNLLVGFLLASPEGKLPRVILVTSPAAGDGKTTVSSNLGILLAANRRRVLLLDAAGSNGRLLDLFAMGDEPELARLVESSRPLEEWQVEEAVRPTRVPGLSVLGGGMPPVAASARGAARMAELLLLCRRRYDVILIDGPPLDEGGEARRLAQMSDGTLLVARAGAGEGLAREAGQFLAADGVPLLGVIRNDAVDQRAAVDFQAQLARAASSRPVAWTAALAVLVLALFSLVSDLRTVRNLPESFLSGNHTVLPAQIRPGRTIEVTAPVAGKLTAIRISAGASVRAGEVLAEVDGQEARDQLRRAESRMALARERISSLSPGREAKAIRIGDARREQAAEALAGARERLQAFSLEAAERAYAEARRHTSRIQELVPAGLATEGELADSRRQESVELRNLQAAREHRSRLDQELRNAERDLRAAEMEQPAGSALERMSAQMEYDEAAEQVRRAQAAVDGQVLRSEADGVVMAVTREAGDLVRGGEVLVVLADLSTLVFEVPMTAEVALRIRKGDPVLVRIPTNPPRQVEARVSAITLAPDRVEQAYLVYVRIPNPAPDVILAGLRGAVEFGHGNARPK